MVLDSFGKAKTRKRPDVVSSIYMIILVQYYGERELVPASYCFSVAVKSAHFLIAIFYRSSSSSSFKKAVVSDHIDNDDIQQWIVFQGVIQIAYNSTIATKAHELMHISLSSLINYEIRPIGLRLSQDFDQPGPNTTQTIQVRARQVARLALCPRIRPVVIEAGWSKSLARLRIDAYW